MELRQAQRRLSPAKLEALIADYEAGGRVGELVKVYGPHRTTVAAHVARAGKTRPVMTEAQIDGGQRRLSPSAAQARVTGKERVTGTTG